MMSKLTYLKKLELFKELDSHKEGQFFAIADYAVKNHVPQWIQFSPRVFWLKKPHEEKNLETYERCLSFLLKQGIQSSSHLYCFGGTATSEFSGFVAATLYKGLAWTCIPTTLLAMTSGSIGGQGSLNLPQGENLISTTHFPENIFFCPDFLTSLSEDDTLNGKAEIVRLAFLSRDIHDMILKKRSFDEVIFECAKFKNEVVINGSPELKSHFELGSFFARGFEQKLGLSSGHALIMGLKCLFKIMKLDDCVFFLEKVLNYLDLPASKFDLESFTVDELHRILAPSEVGKKTTNIRQQIVSLKRIGTCHSEEISSKDLLLKIQDFKTGLKAS